MGPFITLIATTYGISEGSVGLVARVLREAGWLTTGARGVNAPNMIPLDAARLSLALLAGEPSGAIVEEFEFLRTLQARTPYPVTGLTADCGLAADHSLEQALAWLFSLTTATPSVQVNGTIFHGHWSWPRISVSVDASARAAHIQLASQGTAYEDLAGEQELQKLETAPYSDEKLGRLLELWDRSGTWDSGTVTYGRGMRVIRTITQDEISKISDAIAGIDRNPASAT